MNSFKNKKPARIFCIIFLLFICSPLAYSQRFFEFGCVGFDNSENFIAATFDTLQIALADSLLLLPDSLRGRHIHGCVAHGNPGYNLNWHWHFIPNSWHLVEESAEVCDTRPSAIERDTSIWTDGWLFCPFCSYVIREIFPMSVKYDNEISSEQSITIYPNPSYGVFLINIPALKYKEYTLKVFNILGQLVFTKSISNADFTLNPQLDITHISSGIYFVQLALNNQIIIKKLIKR